MPTVDEKILFKAGLQAAFDGIDSKDVNTIYFVTDTQRLFVGETEYSRPVQHGAEVPSTYAPANSLFVKETGTARELYYSKDGASWDLVCQLPAEIEGGVFGNNTTTNLAFEGTFKVPKVTVDDRGNVTAIEDVTLTLPAAPEDAAIQVTAQGSGPIVGSVTKGSGTTEIVVQNKSLADLDIATETDLTAAEGRISTLETGKQDKLEFQTAYNAQSNKAATMADVTNAVAGLSGAMHYVGESTTDPSTGTATVAGHEDWAAGDVVTYQAKEYVYDGEDWRELGDESSFAVKGSIKNADIAADAEIAQSKIEDTTGWISDGLNGKVDKTTTVNGQALSGNVQIDRVNAAGTADKVANALTINGTVYDGSAAQQVTIPTEYALEDLTDVTVADPAAGQALVHDGTDWKNRALTKADVGLGNVDNTADANKVVASAGKLTTARNITLSGDATGTAAFDGSANASITVTVSHAAAADTATSATSAESATKATQDAAGNVISDTYATKEEVEAAALVWGSF